MPEKKIRIDTLAAAQGLLGPYDENIKILEKEFQVKLTLRGEDLKITGGSKNINRAVVFIERLLANDELGDNRLSGSRIYELMKEPKTPKYDAFEPARDKFRHCPPGKKAIGPRTKGQKEYFEAIKKNDIVFGIGPAGTGKTYLAMACAVESLRNQEVRRIILTRPAIEAGESLGFLPGDMYEKISPYLRPLYDAIYDMMEAEKIEKYLETGIIEVAPLAYMRGRTLNDAFIILDEAQNATPEQLKMFLTRLGFDSKAVITGDITQSDLPGGKPTGLLQAMETLKAIQGIKFINFSGEDVVRHELVQKIIEAYEKANRDR
ncbi:MAG: PhoH family protein [Candidatus Omnitrophica bacterium]|nr:PhoH family protein [Candidatus Omnitrophota bacterium]